MSGQEHRLVARVLLGVIVGTAVGTALGYVDTLVIERWVSFEQAKGFLTTAQLLVRHLPAACNALGGALFGALAALFVRSNKLQVEPPDRSFLSTALPGAVLGATAGGILGYGDLLLLSNYLNLLDSDNAAAWREHRSILLFVNASAGLILGACLGGSNAVRKMRRA